jgi:hypothetical protein
MIIARIEKNKREQLVKIKTETEQKLKDLGIKHAVGRKVGKSFGFLVYAIVGLFIFFITFSDIAKVYIYCSSKFKKQQANRQKDVTAQQKNRDFQNKFSDADLQKLNSLDERIYQLQVDFYKATTQKNSINPV